MLSVVGQLVSGQKRPGLGYVRLGLAGVSMVTLDLATWGANVDGEVGGLNPGQLHYLEM